MGDNADDRPVVTPEDAFSVGHLSADLAGRSVRGGAVMMADQMAKFVIRAGSLMIMARLLTPTDFGMYAIAIAFVGVAGALKDLGLSVATVQRAVLTRGQISTLFWLNVATGLALFLLICAAAPLIARFYDEPALAWLTIFVAGELVVGGLGIQHLSLLKRNMRFERLAVIEIAAMLVGVGVGIAAALGGLGYWALGMVLVTGSAAASAMAWIASGWRPGRPSWEPETRSMVRFGGHLAFSQLLYQITRGLDRILIGRFVGPVAAGLYLNAYQLLFLPTKELSPPFTTVALSALSRVRESEERFRRFYFQAVLLLASIVMPIVTFLIVTAERSIVVILGEQWAGAAPLMQALGVAAFLNTFASATGWLFISLGQTHRMSRWQLFGSAVTAAFIAIGLRWGTVGVAVGLSAAQLVLFVPAVLYCYRGAPLRFAAADLAAVLWRPALASVLGAAAVLLWRGVGTDRPTAVGLALDFGVYVFVYVLVFFVLPGGSAALRDAFGRFRHLRGGWKK